VDVKKIKTKKKQNTGIITFNSPETFNIIDDEVITKIKNIFTEMENDPEIKVIFINGECGISRSGKKLLSAGFDLKQYPERIETAKNNPETFKAIILKNLELFEQIEKSKKPVIAGINGIISGFVFELAMACDIILCSESAEMALNEINIGIIPGYGSIYRLLKLVGKNKTFEIVAKGDSLNANEAKNLNIVTNVYKDNDFYAKSIEYCHNLAQKSPKALCLIKKILYEIYANNEIKDLQLNNFIEAVKSNDAQEGISAFLEKRNAVFQ